MGKFFGRIACTLGLHDWESVQPPRELRTRLANALGELSWRMKIPPGILDRACTRDRCFAVQMRFDRAVEGAEQAAERRAMNLQANRIEERELAARKAKAKARVRAERRTNKAPGRVSVAKTTAEEGALSDPST